MSHNRAWSIALRFAVATAISAVVLYFLTRKMQWTGLMEVVSHIRLIYVLGAFLLLLVANSIRARRFQELDATHNSYGHWWAVTQTYNFATSTLPGGLGEVSTVVLLRRFSQGNWSQSLRILVVARLMDLGALMMLLVGSALTLSAAWQDPTTRIAVSVALPIGLAAIVLLIPTVQRIALSFVTTVLPKKSRLTLRAKAAVLHLMDASTYGGMAATSRLIVYSAATAICAAVALYSLLRGLDVELTPLQSMYCYGLYILFQLIPIQGIAGLGTQSARWAAALVMVGYRGGQQIALGFAIYSVLFLIVVALAILAAPFWFLHGRRRTTLQEEALSYSGITGSMPLDRPDLDDFSYR